MTSLGFRPYNSGAMRMHLAEGLHDWHPDLIKVTQIADDYQKPQNLYMLPVGKRWTHGRGFTLIGDAAHLMALFAGEGANLALADAHNVA
jgi:2-polyprenyl-6-methoxyphenol hydroxylase-like FAD-dependent oxidoreductase